MFNDFLISPHFKLKEFACPCCQRIKLAELGERLGFTGIGSY